MKSFCPKCNGEMDQMGIVCPHCGYDFPISPKENKRERTGLYYSEWSNIMLIICEAISVIACIMTLPGVIKLFLEREFLEAILSLFVVIILFGFAVVFGRVRTIK